MQDDFNLQGAHGVEAFSRHDLMVLITQLCDGIDEKKRVVKLASDMEFSFFPDEDMKSVERRARSICALQVVAEILGEKENYADHLKSCKDDPMWFREQASILIQTLEHRCINTADASVDELEFAVENYLIGFDRYGIGYDGATPEHNDIAAEHVAKYRICESLHKTLAKLRSALEFSDQGVSLRPLPRDVVALFPDSYNFDRDDDTNVVRFG